MEYISSAYTSVLNAVVSVASTSMSAQEFKSRIGEIIDSSSNAVEIAELKRAQANADLYMAKYGALEAQRSTGDMSHKIIKGMAVAMGALLTGALLIG